MRRFETSPGRPLFLVGFADPCRAAPDPGKLSDLKRRCAWSASRAATISRRAKRRILANLAHGKANKTIAVLLLSKFDCESRAEAVARFLDLMTSPRPETRNCQRMIMRGDAG